jgi:hypothetical protein
MAMSYFPARHGQSPSSPRPRTLRRPHQDGFYDHVLRREEDSLAIAAYIVANPVRAGLVKSVTEYSYSGSSLYSLHELAGI